MTIAVHRGFDVSESSPDRSLDYEPVAAVLALLDNRPGDPVARSAARIIRALEIQVQGLEGEVIEAEWRALAHSVEIARMNDLRNAFWERRTTAKAGRR